MATQCKIVNGPSKFDLMLALFDSCSKSGYRRVTFNYIKGDEIDPKNGHKICYGLSLPIEVLINEVGKEDGSGESWMFKGTIEALEQNRLKTVQVRGYFHTQHRNGWIQFS